MKKTRKAAVLKLTAWKDERTKLKRERSKGWQRSGEKKTPLLDRTTLAGFAKFP